MSILTEIIFIITILISGTILTFLFIWFINAFAIWNTSRIIKKTNPKSFQKHPEIIESLFKTLPGDKKERNSNAPD